MRSKVAILQEPGRFTIEERDVCCAADEVLVKVAVCGLCNWEKGFFTGVLPGAPCTLGHEWAGMVVETGSEVTTLQPGDKVAVFPDALRGFAEYAPVKAANCFRLADHVDVYQGFAEPLKCVVTVLRSARPEAGDFGVVVGCGPMGLWCIQALAGRMLGGLIAVDIDDGKLAAAKQNGATHVINSKTQDAEALVREATDGSRPGSAVKAFEVIRDTIGEKPGKRDADAAWDPARIDLSALSVAELVELMR